MPIVPSAELLAKLRASRFNDRVADSVREAVGADALFIGGTIGASWFLTADGRVLEHPDEDADPTVRELVGDAATWVLADCAWARGVPELLDLLPPAPAAAVVCRGCQGGRYLRLDGDIEKTRACYECHGRGWLTA